MELGMLSVVDGLNTAVLREQVCGADTQGALITWGPFTL